MSKQYLRSKLSDSLSRMEIHPQDAISRLTSEKKSLQIAGIDQAQDYVTLGTKQKKLFEKMIKFLYQNRSEYPLDRAMVIRNSTAAQFISLLRYIQDKLFDE